MPRLLAFETPPYYAQVHLLDPMVRDTPQFETGLEEVVFGPGGVVVATRPDHLGTVAIEVRCGSDYQPLDEQTCLVAHGDLVVGSSGLVVGSVVGSDLRPVELGKGVYQLQVFVRKSSDGPTAVIFILDRPGTQ
jgi:hypothetical protein